MTDPTGREVHGKLERLTSDALVVTTSGSETFAAADVRRIRTRDGDSAKNGALIGLGIGGVDRFIPGKMRVIYQAPLSHASGASLSLAPFTSARAKGLAVSFAF